MSEKNVDFDNVIKQSGNATVFVYVDTTSIAYAMLCCFGALAVTNQGDSNSAGFDRVMKGMLSSFDQFLKEDKKRQEKFIREVQKAMKT